MAAKFIKITGLPELLDKLNALGEVTTINAISYRGTFGAAKEVKLTAQEFSKGEMETGAMFRQWAQKRVKYGTKLGYTVGVRHGPKRGKFAGGDDPYYWWFQEFGTARHVEGKHYLARAFNIQRNRAAQQIIAAGRKAVLDSGNRVLRQIGSGK